MSWCGNRSPITGECILGCPGIGGCKRGLETPEGYRWEHVNDPRPRPSHYVGLGNCRCVVVPIPLGSWPQDVTVPPPVMRGRFRDAQVGTEEGDTCFRDYGDSLGWCQGHLELRRDADLGGCSCHRSAPCSSCMSEVPECDLCGHREPEPC